MPDRAPGGAAGAGGRLRRALLVAGLLAATLTLPFFIWSVVHWTATPLDSTSPESCNVYHCMQLAAGRTIYPDFRRGPHVANGHAPVAFLLPALACRMAGGAEPVARSAGRLLSLAAFLATVALVFLALRRRGEGALAAAAAASLLLTCPVFYAWTSTCRPDCLAVALAMGGFLMASERRTAGRLLAAGGLLLLAAYTSRRWWPPPWA